MPYRSGFIAIIGRPNVGKSTLMNQILGEKIAIVTDKPQTTRNRILGVHHFQDAQMVFLDTPGIHRARGGLNLRMVKTAFAALAEVDLILFLVDPHQKWGAQEEQIALHLAKIKTPKILVVNKIDRLDKDVLIPQLNAYHKRGSFSEMIPLSALTGENVDRLLTLAKTFLPEGHPFFPEDVLTDQPVRTLAAEFVREQIINQTREEIPYAIAVEVEALKENVAKHSTTLHVTIYVEQASQKGMLIGKGGLKLKAIREGAQSDLERLLATKVSLVLWVKVKKNWRDDSRFLTHLGY